MQKRTWTIILIVLLIPIGIYTKFYAGPLSGWVNNSLGGDLYVIFWSLLVFLFRSSVSPFKISLGIFLITCVIEFLQLWKAGFLTFLRGNFIGRTILGTSFSWLDFPHYLLGFFISWILLNKLSNIKN